MKFEKLRNSYEHEFAEFEELFIALEKPFLAGLDKESLGSYEELKQVYRRLCEARIRLYDLEDYEDDGGFLKEFELEKDKF